MEPGDNAIGPRTVTASAERATRPALPPGLLLGALGVLAFSFSLPATKLALGGIDPWVVAFGRAVVAAVFAAGVLRATRAPRPARRLLGRLVVVGGGVVVGFPLFSSLALTTSGSAHGAVVIAILPAATALVAVVRAGERPGSAFWLAAASGLAVVLAFTVATAGGALTAADAFLLAAIAACAVGYAEGGAVARELGGARTICWALVLSAPVTVPVTVAAAVLAPPRAGPGALAGFAYVSVFSMFLGFFAWYAGLARGGVARIGQVQLVQPLLGIGWSALLLGEHVTPGMTLVALVVVACVVVTQRARVREAT